MKPDRLIDSIVWGKKYPLKDRTPQLVALLFIVVALVIVFLFSGVKNECHEKNSNSDKTTIQKSSN